MKLIFGDCHEQIKNLESKSIDHFIFDLPYNCMDYEWDKNIIDLELMWTEIKRIKKLRKSNIIMFCDMRFGNKLINSNPNWFRYSMIWSKGTANHLSNKKKPCNSHEIILLFCSDDDDVEIEYNLDLRLYSAKVMAHINKPLCQIFKDFGNRTADHFLRNHTSQFGLCTEETYNKLIALYKINEMYKFKEYSELQKLNEASLKVYNQTLINEKVPLTVLEYKILHRTKQLHPTEKPQDLLEWLISSFTNKNNTVLDITMGSGSTGEACKKLNRNFIGIEQDPKYYDIARNRLLN